MHDDLKALQQKLSDPSFILEADRGGSALDGLYWQHSEYHALSNEKTRRLIRELDGCLNLLPLSEKNSIFAQVDLLCAERERLAFLAGLQLGAQAILDMTIDAEPEKPL